MEHLYKLSEQYRDLVAILSDEETKEETLKDKFKEIATELNEKAESIGKIILELEAETSTIKTEMERLSNRKRIAENKITWLKSYVLQEMLLSGIDKIPGQILTLSLRTAPPSVIVLNQEEVEVKFRRQIPATWEINKQLAISNFKETGEIPKGLDIVADKKTLVVK